MKFYQHYSLKKKFFILSCCFIVICSILTVSLTLGIKNLLFEKQISYATSSAQHFESEIDYIYKKVYTLYDFLLFDPNIERLFLDPFTADTMGHLNNINDLMLSIGIMNEDIVDIALVGEHFSYSGLFDDNYITALTAPLSSGTAIHSLGIMPSSFFVADDTQYLVFHKNVFTQLNSSTPPIHLGHILISVDPSELAHSLPRDIFGDTTYFMVVDKSQNIYPFNLTTEDAQSFVDTILPPQVFSESQEVSTTLTTDTSDFLIHTSFIPEMAYYIISAIDKKQLLLQLKDILFLSSLVITAIVLFTLLSIALILSNILRPLNNMYLFIKDISQGNMKQLKQPLVLEGSTEITALSSSFNTMMAEITSLNTQLFSTATRLYELEIQKNKAEILHLRSQINPHFLHNTLESIRGLALESNSPEIAEIAFSMGKISNYSIRGTHQTNLEEEISIIKCYMAIQLIRFNSKFDILYNTPQQTLQLLVPKMILQPLIENAIFHGLEPKLRQGLLYIGSSVSDDILTITIQDDGVGIPPHILDALNAALSAPSTEAPSTHIHIGILNVHNRIRLEYGDSYGLFFESTVDIGTKVTVSLPILLQGGSYA
ncbi:MAG: sensor histidine kinase [Cellulosilyticaceae bacterium]